MYPTSSTDLLASGSPVPATGVEFSASAINVLTGASPAVAALYIAYQLVRLLVPAALIVLAMRDATADHRIGLLQAYLSHNTRNRREQQPEKTCETSQDVETSQ
jgi:hypothetical protein